MTRSIFLALLIIALSSACGAEPTPYPVYLPTTPTDAPIPTDAPPVRYALAANTLGTIAESDYNTIVASGAVEQLTETVNLDDLGARYDIVATYGDWAGWTRSPVTPQVMLVINPTGESLTPQLANTIRQAIDASAIVTTLNIPGIIVTGANAASPPSVIRTNLANLGRPDGLQLTLGYAYTPGVSPMVTQLAAVNVETQTLALSNEAIRVAFTEGRIQLALVTWTTPEQQQQWLGLFGAENTLDLYSLPISYCALPDLTITFTSGGWPIAGYTLTN